MDFMNFVTENYLWFIVGGIVILMIIIGYFAEKTNFGRKSLSQKNENTEPTQVSEPVVSTQEPVQIDEPMVNDEMKLEEKGINDILGQNANNEGDILNIPNEMENSLDEVVEPVQIDEPTVSESPVVGFPDEDLTVPLEDNSIKEVQNETPEITEIPDVLDDSEADNEDDVWKF